MNLGCKAHTPRGRVGLWVVVAVCLLAVLAPQSAGRPFVKAHPAAPAEIWAVGDGADGSDSSISVAQMIARNRPDRFLYLGDVYETGTAAEFTENYRSVYGRFDRIAAPTPGNHEWGNRDEGYRPYWAAVKRRPTPDWYAFRVAGWQILSLNSEADRGPGSDQLRWLRRRLRTTPKLGNCRVAFWHRPRFSAGRAGDDPGMGPPWRALAHRARIVLNGHDHDMQRHRRRDGITAMIAGTGGHELRDVDETDPRLTFAADGVPGALRLVIRPRRARSAFFSADGVRLDAHKMSCRRGA